ncbi:hypothetical protein [Anaeromassilibacillus senegalensis]|uniref:hypothetical protein n=1 Tax=Anaeromassilibacillus senegalensis TaxID=1673717 RepID=UPI00067F953E|nr:hypothetical protein [Anaeromassilibacillus senegalensis]
MEWQMVCVIIALVGLVGAIVGPIVKLNTNITKLTVTLQNVEVRMERQEESGHEARKRLWDKNEEQDKVIADHGRELSDHEGRISRLEKP